MSEVGAWIREIRGSEEPEHVEIPSCEVDLREERRGKKNTLRRPEHVENPSCGKLPEVFSTYPKTVVQCVFL